MCRWLGLEFRFAPAIPQAEIQLGPIIIDPQNQIPRLRKRLRRVARAQ